MIEEIGWLTGPGVERIAWHINLFYTLRQQSPRLRFEISCNQAIAFCPRSERSIPAALPKSVDENVFNQLVVSLSLVFRTPAQMTLLDVYRILAWLSVRGFRNNQEPEKS